MSKEKQMKLHHSKFLVRHSIVESFNLELMALYPRIKMKPSMIAKATPMTTADDLMMKKATP